MLSRVSLFFEVYLGRNFILNYVSYFSEVTVPTLLT